MRLRATTAAVAAGLVLAAASASSLAAAVVTEVAGDGGGTVATGSAQIDAAPAPAQAASRTERSAGVRSSAARTAAVDLREWRIDAPATPVRAGRVQLTVRNTGRVEHDLVLVRTDLPADRLPVGLEGVAPQTAGRVVLGREHLRHSHDAGAAARHPHLRAGATSTERVRLRPGRYVALCPIPGHYEAGQRAVLVVR